MSREKKVTLEYFRKQGRLGGKKAAQKLTPEQRSERARKGHATRKIKAYIDREGLEKS